jgi:hypothetical protein
MREYRRRGPWVIAALTALLSGAAAYRLANKPWRQYAPCAAIGGAETRVRAELLSDAPPEQRYRAVFVYFAHGFRRHLTGFSRVQYCGAGSFNSYAISGLEGFARTAPLLAAWVYSGRGQVIQDPLDGRPIDLVAILKTGILGGVDRRSRDYWGDIRDNDQRIVEAADIARTLWLTRASIWQHLSEDEKRQVTQWLLPASRAATPQNNWILFPITVDLVLASLDAPADDAELTARAHREFDKYKRFYSETGWFLDGSDGIDFYNTWGITYELFWLHQIASDFEPEFITPAIADSATLTEHLISPHGIPIMGRSVCYRTSVPVPVIAASLSTSPEAAPGVALRALDSVWRYFVGHDAISDGALTQGYFGPDPRFLDRYSGGGSCQWGLRSLVLAFMHGAGDRFWTDAPGRLPVEVSDYQLEYPKLGWRVAGHASTGEITIEILKNAEAINRPDPYTRFDELVETILRRPMRPGNYQVKYASRYYSSAHPFPVPDSSATP